ncbi:nucleic acid-binding proteins superfamily isoform X2 [Wolffia australiana]
MEKGSSRDPGRSDPDEILAEIQMGHDAFLKFVDYAISELSPLKEEGKSVVGEIDSVVIDEGSSPSWSWVVSRMLKTCLAYSSGVTPAIILSELFQAWNEQKRYHSSRRSLAHMIPLDKRRRRTRLPNTVTIDAIYEKEFLSINSILEAVVLKVYVLPGTDIYMLKLGDFWSSCTIDLYLHRRYYNLVHPEHGIFKEGREVFLTGCCLRTGATGSGYLRLLPTEYLLILLDEDNDEDAMLLGAQFCSDTFSSISANDFKQGTSYSFYTRVKFIEQGEIQAKPGYVQRRRITLVDCDGISQEFVLWGDQTLLGNLLSVGSMLALEKPFLGTPINCGFGENEGITVEFGSATQLYLVPFVQPEEQVFIASTQSRSQRSSMPFAAAWSKDLKDSQVTLLCDSEGSVDFRNYQDRVYVVDLRGKMTRVCLYGLVRDLRRDTGSPDFTYSLMLEDPTGVVVIKLHFSTCWSLGKLNAGHTIFISGILCCVTMDNDNLIEVSWHEKESDASLINLSCLPAILNSSCLHKQTLLSNLSSEGNGVQVCCVSIAEMDHNRLFSRFFHATCGHLAKAVPDGGLRCSLCCTSCDSELVRGFHLQVPLKDDSSTVSAWCSGQAASDLLQIYPDDFFELPEVEQGMYLCTLENEKFLVALANTNILTGEESDPTWEIVLAQKCD